jgi:hypothetical protein
MVKRHSISVFLSGVAFALAVMLSCKNQGRVTADANVADASPPDVTGPSECCSSITVSGLTRTVSADSDPAQMKTAVLRVFEGQSGPLVSGPFVVTTLMQNTKSRTSSVVTIEYYLSTGSCITDASNRQTFFTLTNSPAAAGERGFAGRLWLAAGTSLCYTALANSPFDELYLSYSGFASY